jgi:fumarate reductase subunit C
VRTHGRPGYPVLVRKVPRAWWLRTGPYRRFFARELTSLFVATFAVILLLLLFALSRGREAYEGFLSWLDLPGVVVLSAVILAAVLYHMATWLRLTAHVQVVRLRGKALRRDTVTAGLVGAWIVVSGVVAYFHIWF